MKKNTKSEKKTKVTYDEILLKRVLALLAQHNSIEQKKMFGGVCVLLNGHMICGVEKNQLLMRVGVENHKKALAQKHASEMKFTSKPMRGFILVKPPGYKTESALKWWIDLSVNFVFLLPKKKKPPSEYPNSTPLRKVKNFGPVTAGELTSIGIETIGQMREKGFEETCRLWVQYYPERMNANAFLGVVCALENTLWTKATSDQRKQAHAMARMLRAEMGKFF
jgi:TfoX/Sxy family transcriptional regulator of competence genes